jgi:hypothetical protein
VDWTHMAQNRHQWLTLVNTVMSLWVTYQRISWLAERLVPSEGLDTIERIKCLHYHLLWNYLTTELSRIYRCISSFIGKLMYEAELQCTFNSQTSGVCCDSSVPCVLKTRGSCRNRSRDWGLWGPAVGFSVICTSLDVTLNKPWMLFQMNSCEW